MSDPEWIALATENRGIAEAMIVLEEYLKETESKSEIQAVIDRLATRMDWLIFRLRQLTHPEEGKNEVIEKKDG